MPGKDTLRVLVSWKCNLNCSYCCNEIPEIREKIRPLPLRDLDATGYKNVCVSGGEPLLFPDLVKEVCVRSMGKFIVLYTNGICLTPETAKNLEQWGVKAVNIGLHSPAMFDLLVARVREAVSGTSLSVRYHYEDTHPELPAKYPSLTFKPWHRDDCDRDNEDRVILS